MIQNISLPERTATSFDYGDLSAEDRKTVEVATASINSRYKQVVDNILVIGKHLCEVKKILSHGQFGKWLAYAQRRLGRIRVDRSEYRRACAVRWA